MYKVILKKKLLSFINKQLNKNLLLEKIKTLKYFQTNNLNADIKRLKGNLSKYYRLRIGNIRVLFYINNEEIVISRIDFRNNVYK